MRLVAKNFRSYEYFDLHFVEGTNNLVLGDSGSNSDYATTNASGKSSIMYAVMWALFGKWPDMQSANSPVNIVAEKECEVYYEFKNTQGQACAVKRCRKPNSLEFWCNSEPVTGDMAVVQNAINEAIGCTYDFYLKVFVYSGDKDTKFSRLTDAKQKEILDTILPMDFEAAKELAVKQGLQIKSKIAENKHQIDTWTNQVETLKLKRDLAKTNAATFDQQATRDRTPLEQDIRETKRRITEYEAVIEQNRAAIIKAQEDLSAAKLATARLNDKRNERQRLQTAMLEANTALHGHSEKLDKIRNEETKDCPMCGQILGAPYSKQQVIATMDKECVELIAKAATATNEYNAVTEELNLMPVPPLDVFEQRYSAITAVESEHRTYIQRAQDRISRLQKEIEAIPAPGTENPYHTEARVYGQQIVDLESEICTTDQQIIGYELDLDLWNHVIDAFSTKGVKHYAFETLCPEMTAIAQAFMHHLSADQLKLKFRSHKASGKKIIEGFHVEVTRKIGGKIKEGYGDMSGGEKSRVDLVVFLTLYLMAQKHVNNTGLLFLDEIADTLDPAGKAAVVELLDFFTKEYGVTSLILTNDERVASYITQGYRCRLLDGRGRIEELSAA